MQFDSIILLRVLITCGAWTIAAYVCGKKVLLKKDIWWLDRSIEMSSLAGYGLWGCFFHFYEKSLLYCVFSSLLKRCFFQINITKTRLNYFYNKPHVIYSHSDGSKLFHPKGGMQNDRQSCYCCCCSCCCDCRWRYRAEEAKVNRTALTYENHGKEEPKWNPLLLWW